MHNDIEYNEVKYIEREKERIRGECGWLPHSQSNTTCSLMSKILNLISLVYIEA